MVARMPTPTGKIVAPNPKAKQNKEVPPSSKLAGADHGNAPADASAAGGTGALALGSGVDGMDAIEGATGVMGLGNGS